MTFRTALHAAAAAAAFVALTPGGRAAQVQLSLQAETADGTPLEAVRVGDEFYLSMYAADLRPNPQGVFSAYADVLFDASIASMEGAIDYSPRYSNAKTGKVEAPGFVDEAGAFVTNLFSPSGGGDQQVLRLALTADAAGEFYASLDPADERFSETILYGEDVPLAASDISFVGEALPVFEFVLGDMVVDGVVDLNDFNLFKTHFGNPEGCPNCDLNSDGAVDLFDFSILKQNFGASAVPEPSTLLLLTALAAPCGWWSRRRISSR